MEVDTTAATSSEHADSADGSLTGIKRERAPAGECSTNEPPKGALTVLLHDVSGSMRGGKHQAAAEAAAREIDDEMANDAELSTRFLIGYFNNEASFLTTEAQAPAEAREALRQLPEPNGGTALYTAVKETVELVERILRDAPDAFEYAMLPAAPRPRPRDVDTLHTLHTHTHIHLLVTW